MIIYDTRRDRTIDVLTLVVFSIFYFAVRSGVLNLLHLGHLIWLRVLLTWVHATIFVIGGVKFFRRAEQAGGKLIGILLMMVAILEFALALYYNFPIL